MTALAPYRSDARPGRDGFAQLLHAEWTKFRTVRGWMVGMFVAALLTAGIALVTSSGCGFNSSGATAGACSSAPIGPNGAAVTDHSYFVHQPLTGDAAITVRVTSLTGLYSPSGYTGASQSGRAALKGYQAGVQPWAKAGIMIKAMLVTGGNGVRMQYDYTGDLAGLPGEVSAASPRWLRLVRSGNTVAGYDSLDGTHWSLVGNVTLSGLPRTAQAGLFTASPSYMVVSQSLGTIATAGAAPTLATAAFDHVGVSRPGGAWTGTSVGARAGQPGGTGASVNGPGSAAQPFNGGFRRSGRTAFTVSGSGDIAPDVPNAADGEGTTPTQALNVGTFLGLIAMVVIGAMFITAEYRRGLIRTTLTATPSRGRVLAAKALVIAAVTFVAGLAATAIALPVGEAHARGSGSWFPPLSALTEARVIVGTAALMAVASALALALGVIARRGVAAVSAAIVLIVLPFLLAFLPGALSPSAQGWLLRISPAAAFAVQQAFPAYHQVVAPYAASLGYYPLAPWAGFLVLCAWAAVALAAAAYLLRRRDA
jgi:ABC-type transport system involved in multi-copper enzyme maturation permease subunit